MTPKNLDLDTLRALVLANELGSFGRAAEQLGRTPSAISLQMKRLQEDVGLPIFHKDGRQLALTECGKIVLRYAKNMLEMNDELLVTISGATMSGKIRVGFAQDFVGEPMVKALTAFAQSYPLVQTEVRIGLYEELVHAVESGDLDLALVFGHSERAKAQVVGDLPLIWIADKNFVQQQAGKKLPLVMFTLPCIARERACEVLENIGMDYRIALTSPSLEGLWTGIRSGLGITVRTKLGLPTDLKSSETLFDLPHLGSIPITLLRTTKKSRPTECFEAILNQVVKALIVQKESSGTKRKKSKK